MGDLERRRGRVTGRVQGVGFRAFTAQTARRMGLRGWVRNCQDGSVELAAIGERPVLVSRAGSPLPTSPVLDAPGGVASPRMRPARPSSPRLARDAETSATWTANFPHGTLAQLESALKEGPARARVDRLTWQAEPLETELDEAAVFEIRFG